MSSRIPDGSASAVAHLYLREEQMRQAYEALLLAWRSLNAECDTILRENGLGSAHHRILFLVSSHENITPSVLLERLGITKQSLGRALNDLKERQMIEQGYDANDRRLRPLRLTEKGLQIEQRLFRLIRGVMTNAYREAGVSAVEGFRRVLAPLQENSEGKIG